MSPNDRRLRAAACGALGFAAACALGAAGASPLASVAQATDAGAGASTSSVTGGERSPASATLEKCVIAGDQLERYATFVGRMVALPGATEMAMRIDIEERARGHLFFRRVEGAASPGLGAWRASEPGVQIFKDVKQVSNLAAQLEYRALVRFRWTGPKGIVVKREVLRTPACRQPGHAGQVGSETSTARMPGR